MNYVQKNNFNQQQLNNRINELSKKCLNYEDQLSAYRQNFLKFVCDYQDLHGYDKLDQDRKSLVFSGLFNNKIYKLLQKIFNESQRENDTRLRILKKLNKQKMNAIYIESENARLDFENNCDLQVKYGGKHDS